MNIVSYHHRHRIEAHAQHIKLTATQRNTASELALRLNDKTGTFQASASYLSKQTGHTEKTTQAALRDLIALGIFTATRPHWKKPRVYTLAITCPVDCLKLKLHNPPRELARMKSLQVIPEAMTSKNLSMTGKNDLTNRTKYIDDIDTDLDLSIAEVIASILEHQAELTANQTKLRTWLISSPSEVEARALHLAAEYDIPGDRIKAWLETIILGNPRKQRKANPETLFRHLEREAKTSKKQLLAITEAATIYKDLPDKPELTRARFELYAKELAGFKITGVSWKYLSKRGLATSYKDLYLAKMIENINAETTASNMNPGSTLELDLIDGKISLSFNNPEATGFDLSILEAMPGLTSPDELREHLEAEKLIAEVRAELEATGQSWRTSPDYWPRIAEIQANYSMITPAEASRRYTQAVCSSLQAMYDNYTGQQQLEALDTWLSSNYTQLNDCQDLIAEHYPEKPAVSTWDEAAIYNAYRRALAKGYTWSKLATLGDRQIELLGSKWPRNPNNWLDDLPPLNTEKPQEAPTSPQVASFLSELSSSFKRA